MSPFTATALGELLPRYLDQECFHIVQGGPEETTQLLREKFDYIMYTGSSRVGKVIAEAAAKTLTPVTLELGGKSPLYVDDSVSNMDVAAKRILWGKFLNNGQTCIAVDHILVTKEVQPRLVESLTRILREFFGEDPQKSPDLGRIVNGNHFK